MKKIINELQSSDYCSTVLYIKGQSDAEVTKKSKDIHDWLRENHLEEKILLSYLDDTSTDELFKHLMNDEYYQAQQYKIVIIYSANLLKSDKLNDLQILMNSRGVKVILLDDEAKIQKDYRK